MRLFVAIDLTDEIRQRISEYITRLQDEFPLAAKAKWVRAESLHLTLKFIGSSDRIDEIKGRLEKVQAKSFEVFVRGVGFFTPRSPRIFWAGVHANEELKQLAITVDGALVDVGIRKESDEYHPHITLARTGSGRPHGARRDRDKPWMLGVQQAIAAKPELVHPDFGTMTPREFFLYRSETLPEGARYTKLAGFSLHS